MARVDRKAATRRTPWWRAALSWLLLLIFCLTAPLAILAGWARYNLVDETRFVQTLAPLANDPRVRDAILDATDRALGIEPAPAADAREGASSGLRFDLPALFGVQSVAAATPEPAVKRATTSAPAATATVTAAATAASAATEPPPSATQQPLSPTPAATATQRASLPPTAAPSAATAAPAAATAGPASSSTPEATGGIGAGLATIEREVVEESVDAALQSPEFGRAWELASKKSYAALTAVEEGSGPVYLDLSGAASRIQRDLADSGVPDIDQVVIPPESLSIEVLDAEAASTVRAALKRLETLGLALPIIAALAFVGSLWAAGNRLRALRRAGFGLAVATIVMLLVLLIGQQGAVTRLNDSSMAGVAQAVIDAVLRMPALWSMAAIAAGLVVAVFAGLLGWLRGR